MADAAPRILMCPPDFYGIQYEINPWMKVEVAADHALAAQQWRALHERLTVAGATIDLLPPVAGLPDLVFTANAALIHRRLAVLARFKHPQRQGETPHDRQWFEDQGYETIDPPGEFAFEGAGDALFCGETLFAGYRMRSSASELQRIGDLLGVRVLPLELVSPRYYHLDTCFCPLSPEEAIYFPGAFDDYARRVLDAHVPRLIAVQKEEAKSFACNAVVVGKRVFTNIGCPRLHDELGKLGYEPTATPLGEFVKAGGSAKCLTLRLDGEEAASWVNE